MLIVKIKLNWFTTMRNVCTIIQEQLWGILYGIYNIIYVAQEKKRDLSLNPACS